MVATLHHRGPDDRGVFVDGFAGLGHTRLSIIDLSSAGHQPMHSACGRYVLSFNGEIYNFRELRKRLEGLGSTFRGHSDSEVLLEAFIAWGVDAFPQLEGMFAFALLDRSERKLFVVRDPFGIKPLYYARLPHGLVFGSEVKALLASGRLDRKLDRGALHEYLYYGNALGEGSLFDGVSKLLPGHYLTVDESGIQDTLYHSIYDCDPIADDLDTATARTRQLLDEAVAGHLISDVPVGVFLSGGIDSSAITALASAHYGGTLKTYSVGFDFDRGVNELPVARKVAEHFGTDHNELQVAGGNLPDVIEKLVHCHDEPFGDAADIPLYLLCQELRGSVKVILQGDGGDEIFAGYRRYNVMSAETPWRLAAWIGVRAGKLMPARPATTASCASSRP